MGSMDLEAKSRLVALARKKAERQGTTLESQVEIWLSRYVNEQEDAANESVSTTSTSKKSSVRSIFPRAMDSISKTSTPSRSNGDTRSAAYRRLLGVMSDTSKRSS